MERLTPAVLDSPTSRKGREKWGTLAHSIFWVRIVDSSWSTDALLASVTHPFRKGREKDGAASTLFLWVGGLSFSRHAIELEGVLSFCLCCGRVGADGRRSGWRRLNLCFRGLVVVDLCSGFGLVLLL